MCINDIPFVGLFMSTYVSHGSGQNRNSSYYKTLQTVTEIVVVVGGVDVVVLVLISTYG